MTEHRPAGPVRGAFLLRGAVAVLAVATFALILPGMAGPGVSTATAAKKPRLAKAPSGARFYSPPARLIKRKRAGTPIWIRNARGPVRAPGAKRTIVVAYRSTSIRNRRTVMTGTIALPPGKAPRGGWPVVSFGHVTTGSADRCAPSRAKHGNPEFERLTRGDSFVQLLLERGIAVARADFEGIGTPGRHPYLAGPSLGRAMTDIVKAGRRLNIDLGRRWAAAGHSEGGQGALFTARVGQHRAPGLRFRGSAAFAPASHISDIVEMARGFTVASPLLADFSALGALIIEGAAIIDRSLWPVLRSGGFSPEALRLMPHTQKRCLVELAREDSFGGLAPADLGGPRQEELLPEVYRVLDANDPRVLKLPGVKVRLDQGQSDLVVWPSHTAGVATALTASGAEVETEVWPGGTHENITFPDFAGTASADWLADRLR